MFPSPVEPMEAPLPDLSKAGVLRKFKERAGSVFLQVVGLKLQVLGWYLSDCLGNKAGVASPSKFSFIPSNGSCCNIGKEAVNGTVLPEGTVS